MSDEIFDLRLAPLHGIVRAMGEPGGDWKLEVLGCPYGGHKEGNRDEWGEYFSERTDFMLDVGEIRPTLYLHGHNPDGQRELNPPVLGKAEVVRRDKKGLWFETILDKTLDYSKRVWEAAIKGTARASTGAIGYLSQTAASGEVIRWMIGELSLFDTGEKRQPVNQLAVAMPMRALFEASGLELPETFTQTVETVKVKVGGRVHTLKKSQIKFK